VFFLSVNFRTISIRCYSLLIYFFNVILYRNFLVQKVEDRVLLVFGAISDLISMLEIQSKHEKNFLKII